MLGGMAQMLIGQLGLNPDELADSANQLLAALREHVELQREQVRLLTLIAHAVGEDVSTQNAPLLEDHTHDRSDDN